MPLNVPGILVPFQLLINPRIVLPGLCVKDIRHLDFEALRRAGYRGAVFDKDNCLTIPYKDELVPELQEVWKQCRQTFGEGNVLVVSNSAGTPLDPGGIQAESVSYHLQAPVLSHTSMKPAYSCIKTIRHYFSSLRTPIRDEELIIVGDRIFTDVVMANRMRKSQSQSKLLIEQMPVDLEKAPDLNEKASTQSESHVTSDKGPLAIWTTGVWKKEAMGMRWCERKLVDAVRRWTNTLEDELITHQFTRPIVEPPRPTFMQRLLGRLGRSSS
ncbi:hypothetical protein AX16_006202 [Volvariella volvacea WC 439]|nr:hypothetical protein AX16_006202 [Volvariella volvacea WC 439]